MQKGRNKMEFEKFTQELRLLCFNNLLQFYIPPSPHNRIAVKVKSDGTAVTSIDHMTLDYFRNLILQNFPDHKTVGEEDKKSPEEMAKILEDQESYYWSIDGLDGTGNLTYGMNSYGAALALRHGPRLLYAAYFRPWDAKCFGNGFFYAEAGRGAWEWCNCQECKGKYHQIHVAPHSDRRLVVFLEGTSTKFHANGAVHNVGLHVPTRPSCSSCVAATSVARGNSEEARALVTLEHKPWDGWPIALMLQEAGALVTDHQGLPYTANDCSNLVAANKIDHDYLVGLLQGKQ